MVNNRLVYTLEPREVIIPEQQYGSRKNRSTTDVHIILEPSIQEVFRKKQHFIMVSLDLEKAYDTCAGGGTLSKHWPITKSFAILWTTEHSEWSF
jgi:hypothetical protein